MSGSEDPLKREVEDWLRSELVLDGPRRIIRVGSDRVQISKVDRDFAAELHRLLAKLPELCSESRVLTAYARRAQVASSETLRSENWRACMYELLSEAAARAGIPELRCAEVRAGIDSVFAVLESVLWSRPRLADDYVPAA